MAKRGRKTKAEEQRGRARAAAPDGRWECPGHLLGDAREAWGHVVGMLSERGNLDKTDPVMVESYAINVQMLRAAQSAVLERGVVTENAAGTAVSNPACAVVNAATMRIKAICYDLGLVPATAKLSETGDPADTGGKWGDLLGVVG